MTQKESHDDEGIRSDWRRSDLNTQNEGPVTIDPRQMTPVSCAVTCFVVVAAACILAAIISIPAFSDVQDSSLSHVYIY
uniref:Col_cuticle_N domain-containing protein n=1 Tax=Steinernema glaseri TaxID=37863 RepID=A0A1I7Z0X2_9BILA